MHRVRTEYEGLVSEIECGQEFKGCPLAEETVTWPLKNELCYPIFNAQPDELLMNSSYVYSNTCTPCEDNLPNDRATLIELRKRLAMELVWLKQAIASRRKV